MVNSEFSGRRTAAFRAIKGGAVHGDETTTDSSTPEVPSLAGRHVGFVGAGQIGAPMVGRLLAAGAHVRVHTRRPEARAALTAAGAEVVDEVRAVGTGSEIVISCLFSDAQLQSVASELNAGLEPGSVLISHTTGSPNTTRALDATLSATGKGLVEAPFSGTPAAVDAGQLTVLIAGAADSVDRVEPVLRAYAGTILRTGKIGTALMLKLLNNVMFTANVQLSLDLVRVAQQLGLPLADVFAVLEKSSGSTRALSYLKEFGTPEAFRSEVQPFLCKDLNVCDVVVDELGVDLGMLGEVAHGPNLNLTMGTPDGFASA